MVERADGEQIAERIEALRAAGRPVVIATDFDGTVAPIVLDRTLAGADPRALAALRALRERGTPVCVVSGRGLEDLAARVGADVGAHLIGEHGARARLADGTALDEPLDAAALALLGTFATRAAALVAGLPGATLDRKRTAFAMHVRAVPQTERAAADVRLEAFGREAHAAGLHTLAGRAVLEVRLPLGDKGAALARVVARIAPGAAVVYAGDDTTDDPALALAARDGLAVFIASVERPQGPGLAGLLVAEQPAWVDALVRMAGRG